MTGDGSDRSKIMNRKGAHIAPRTRVISLHTLYMVPPDLFPVYVGHCILKANSTAPFLLPFRSAGHSKIGTAVLSSRVSMHIHAVPQLSLRDSRLRCQATLTSLLCPARERFLALHILGNW